MIQLLFILHLLCIGESVHNLTFMFVTSFGQSGFNASGVVPAADIALEDINSHPDVLQGYNLMYDKVRDSQCHRGRSLDAFFQGVFEDGPSKLAVVGCGCSVATEPVAEISHQWNISHISYASSSAALSDRSKYKSFFRNTFNMQIIAPALLSAMVHFNWRRIALLTQNEGLFTGTESDIRREFEQAGLGLEVENRLFSTDDNPVTVIEDLFSREQDYRVFFINSFSNKAREIICYAQNHSYTYPRYAWILYDWYVDEWWTVGDHVGCDDSDFVRFLDRAITVQLPEFGNETTDVGTTLTEFRQRYEEKATNESYDIINQAYKLYDVLWVLALALNSTAVMIKEGNTNVTEYENATGSFNLVSLQEFDYSNEFIGCLIRWNIQQTDFSGLTGQVMFDETGTRIHTKVFFRQYQVQGGGLMKISFANVDKTENFTFTLTSDADIYPAGTPLDGSSIEKILTFQTWLIALFDTLASLGIIFALACLLFNLIFRKRRTVRLSSPTLNYFIIAGAILMYVSIYFYLLPTKEKTIVKARCVIEYWLFTIGYSLAFGSVFMKMWRVFQIFHNPQPNRKVLTDGMLIAMVLAITGFTTLLLIIGEAIPFFRGTVMRVRDPENRDGVNSLGIRVRYFVWVCQETTAPSFFWQIFVFFYLILLQVVGLVLAFQTRKVKLPGLRDSKYVAAIIYISSISIVVMALVTFSLENYINIGTGIFVFCVFTLTTIFLVLIFVPKMVLLYRDPHGRKASAIQHGDNPSASKPSNGVEIAKAVELEQKVVSLEKTVKEGEGIIAELRQRIETLTKDKNIIKNHNQLPEVTSISNN